MSKIREIIKKHVTESREYDERVQKTADELAKMFPKGITKKEFDLNIDKAGAATKSFEIRGSSKAKKDFIKDVSSKIKFARDNSKVQAKKVNRDKMLADVMDMIHDAISNSMPDGDPYDYLMPRLRRKYNIRPDDVHAILSAAVKKHENVKDFNAYLEMIWDEWGSGNLGGPKIKNFRNPWG